MFKTNVLMMKNIEYAQCFFVIATKLLCLVLEWIYSGSQEDDWEMTLCINNHRINNGETNVMLKKHRKCQAPKTGCHNWENLTGN